MTFEKSRISKRKLTKFRRTVTRSPYDLNAEWLTDCGFLIVGEETGRHFSEEQASRLIMAAMGSTKMLVGFANDAPFADETSVAFDFSFDTGGITEFNRQLFGLNALLIDWEHLQFVALCTVDDFHVLAGTRQFLERYIPDLHIAYSDFSSFVHGQMESLKPAAQRILDGMAWMVAPEVKS